MIAGVEETTTPLTEDQIQFYEENGYVKLENVLDNTDVEVLRRALAQAVEDKNKYNLNLPGVISKFTHDLVQLRKGGRAYIGTRSVPEKEQNNVSFLIAQVKYIPI